LGQTEGNNGMPATVSCCAEAEIAALHNQSKEMRIVGRGVKVTPLIRILPTSPEMPVRPVRQGAVIER